MVYKHYILKHKNKRKDIGKNGMYHLLIFISLISSIWYDNHHQNYNQQFFPDFILNFLILLSRNDL